jgi:glycosyltransferase involved in cell wall biosynthesis
MNTQTQVKKLAVVCSSGAWGGLEINIFKVCQWLHQAGVELIVFTKIESKLGAELQKLGFELIEYDQKGKKHFLINHAKYINRVLTKYNISNVLIGHYEQHYTVAWAYYLSKQKLNVLYMQQMQHNIKKRGPYYYWMYQCIATWFTPLASLHKQLLQNTPLTEKQIIDLPLSLEVEKFVNNPVSKSEARKKLGFSEQDYIIANVGRLDKEKGQETIIKAAALLKNTIPNLKILIVGEETAGGTGYAFFLQQLVKEHDLINITTFLPFCPEPQNIFRAIDIFVMSSISEPFGMVTIEALLSGTLVIGTNTGGTPDLLENGKYGKLFSPRNENELCERIKEVYLNNEKNTINIENLAKKYSHDTWVENFKRFII